MLLKLRERMSSEKGFTLIELLVVMLIIGILAAIAIPTFFNQKEKAQDTDGKAMAKSAQTAIETYATDNNGSYVLADGAALHRFLEQEARPGFAYGLVRLVPTRRGYTARFSAFSGFVVRR